MNHKLIKYLLSLLLLLSTGLALANACYDTLMDGYEHYVDGNDQWDNAFGYFEQAANEYQQENPDSKKVCTLLQQSQSSFELSINFFVKCSEIYHTAIDKCDGENQTRANSGVEICKDLMDSSLNNINRIKEMRSGCLDSSSK